MSEQGDFMDVEETEFTDYDHQACYIFKPATNNEDKLDKRPSKKRKLKDAVDASFPLLLNGEESHLHADLRRTTFENLWHKQQVKIDTIVAQVDNETLNQIDSFVQESISFIDRDQLRTGVVISGPDSDAQIRLLHQLKEQQKSSSNIFVHLRSSQCPNLQVVLKTIIRLVISNHSSSAVYTEHLKKHKQLIPMNFDLELLQLYVEEKSINKIVISVLDVETFDISILTELMSTLHSWSSSIQFVLLLGIATTVELFESRLPSSTIQLLDAQVFELSPPSDILFQIFCAVQHDSEAVIFLGPATTKLLHEMAQNQGTTVPTFVQALKYTFMSHFFANPLSVLLSEKEVAPVGAATLCEAIRNTDSFQERCERKDMWPSVEGWLENDSSLLETARQAIHEGQTQLRSAMDMISSLRDIRAQIKTLPQIPDFTLEQELYQIAFGLELSESEVFKDVLSAIRMLRSDSLYKLLQKLQESTLTTLDLQAYLESLETNDELRSNPIRSAHDSTLQQATSTSFTPTLKKSTTPKSKLKSSTSTTHKLTSIEKEYTTLLDDLTESMIQSASSATTPLSWLFLIEALIPHAQHTTHLLSSTIFTPRPRHAIERALSTPSDYLGCTCCTSTSTSTSDGTSNLAELHLYTLLQEAGVSINVRDLYDAFEARILPTSCDEETEPDISNKTHSKTSFYRALASLRLVGLVKASTKTRDAVAPLRKRTAVGTGDVEFIAKTSWMGL